MSQQRAVVKHQKTEKASKQIYGICVVVDDFVDSPQVMASRAGGSPLNTLLVRSRHMMVSTFVLSQRLRAMGSLLRVNSQALVVFKLRNRLELDAIIEELSVAYDKKYLRKCTKLQQRARTNPGTSISQHQGSKICSGYVLNNRWSQLLML